MPYVSKDHQRNEVSWFGDVEATVAYCKAAVARICRDYGGDPNALFIAGFSRGAIACNFIGLHDDQIARLWRGFICHSHYEGVRNWGSAFAGGDRASAAIRLARLKGRPQFISHEGSVDQTRRYLEQACPDGHFTYLPLRGWGHTDTWVLHDVPERRALRTWIQQVLGEANRG
jgi:predicted esterase